MFSRFRNSVLNFINFRSLKSFKPKHRRRSRFKGAFTCVSLLGLIASAVFFPAQDTRASASNLLDLNYSSISFGQDADLLRANSNLVAGFSRIYSNVADIGGQGIDARVTLNYVEGHSGNEIASFDEYDNGPNFSFHTQVNGTSSAQVSARFKIEFFESGSLNPVVLNNVRASIADVDTWERTAFYNVSSYTLANPTSISVETLAATYTSFISSASGSSNTDESRIVQVTYDSTSAISVWAGCRQNAVSTIGSNGL